MFNLKVAERDLRSYKRKGPGKSTRKLLNLIRNTSRYDLQNLELLDVGGGIGVIGFELARNGISSVVSVDISSDYLAVSQRESVERGFSDMYEFIQGDLVAVADRIREADIVTLDKSVCCYLNYKELLSLAVSRTRKLLGIVIPRDEWWVRAVNNFGNFFRQITGNRFRSYVHPVAEIQKLLENNGFIQSGNETALEWHILLFKPS